jgi:hypothetical protein
VSPAPSMTNSHRGHRARVPHAVAAAAPAGDSSSSRPRRRAARRPWPGTARPAGRSAPRPPPGTPYRSRVRNPGPSCKSVTSYGCRAPADPVQLPVPPLTPNPGGVSDMDNIGNQDRSRPEGSPRVPSWPRCWSRPAWSVIVGFGPAGQRPGASPPPSTATGSRTRTRPPVRFRQECSERLPRCRRRGPVPRCPASVQRRRVVGRYSAVGGVHAETLVRLGYARATVRARLGGGAPCGKQSSVDTDHMVPNRGRLRLQLPPVADLHRLHQRPTAGPPIGSDEYLYPDLIRVSTTPGQPGRATARAGPADDRAVRLRRRSRHLVRWKLARYSEPPTGQVGRPAPMYWTPSAEPGRLPRAPVPTSCLGLCARWWPGRSCPSPVLSRLV